MSKRREHAVRSHRPGPKHAGTRGSGSAAGKGGCLAMLVLIPFYLARSLLMGTYQSASKGPKHRGSGAGKPGRVPDTGNYSGKHGGGCLAMLALMPFYLAKHYMKRSKRNG